MKRTLVLFILFMGLNARTFAHDITFCGEVIPTDRDFVATKLMNVIRKQIPAVTLTYLRYQSQRYFPAIKAWLKYYNIPEDFKYIPIVECGFRNNLRSEAGAAGFWQLMPETAREQGLVVNMNYDQRMDPYSSTLAACRVILQHYAVLKRNLPKPSWVLTAASYNFGPGNIINAAKAQGSDYFNMKLNAETAEYVYRLIAVKELFERPELYMNGFGTNIFSKEKLAEQATDTAFHAVSNEQRGVDLGSMSEQEKGVELTVKAKESAPETRTQLVGARLYYPARKFHDGDMLDFELLADLRIADASRKKGSVIKGKAWLIDDRVYVDFGYGHDVELQSDKLERGITVKEAQRDGQYVVLKTEVPLY